MFWSWVVGSHVHPLFCTLFLLFRDCFLYPTCRLHFTPLFLCSLSPASSSYLHFFFLFFSVSPTSKLHHNRLCTYLRVLSSDCSVLCAIWLYSYKGWRWSLLIKDKNSVTTVCIAAIAKNLFSENEWGFCPPNRTTNQRFAVQEGRQSSESVPFLNVWMHSRSPSRGQSRTTPHQKVEDLPEGEDHHNLHWDLWATVSCA